MATDTRAAAARAIDAVIRGGAALDEPLAEQLDAVSPRDRALLQQLCFGTLRQFYRLDAILRQVLKKPLKAKDSDIRALLLCGLHQLLDLRTPDHAAISATVDACRTLGKPWATGLVNGILRRVSREAADLEGRLTEQERSNHPGWLYEALASAWPDYIIDMVDANNSHPPMCLRVNQRKVSREEYQSRLQAAGIDAQPCGLSDTGLRLTAPMDVMELPGFEDGLVSVQDEAAQLAATLLSPAPGHRVLDACAAPGGKACHTLELEPALAELVALDPSAARLERVRDNLGRLQLEATVIEGDGRTPPTSLAPASFDRILVDAPCSGTGVIRRHPDIRLLRRPEDIPAFAELQLDILAGLWPLLKPGGELLYVTCSVLPTENAEVVSRFTVDTPDAEVQALDTHWGVASGDGRQLLPTPNGPDGLFFARLRRS